MRNKLLFLHGAGLQGDGQGSTALAIWLKGALDPELQMLHPIMPTPDDPDYDPWKAELDRVIGPLRGEWIFVGHSLGGSVLLKYLTEEKINCSVKAVLSVAAPYWDGDEDWHYEPFTLKAGFGKRLPSHTIVRLYHSTDDPIVPYAHALLYADQLPQAVLRTIAGDDHLFARGLPQLAADIESIAG